MTFRFFSRHINVNVVHVRTGLQRLLENKFFVKAEKCEFNVSSVAFLGYIEEKGQL